MRIIKNNFFISLPWLLPILLFGSGETKNEDQVIHENKIINTFKINDLYLNSLLRRINKIKDKSQENIELHLNITKKHIIDSREKIKFYNAYESTYEFNNIKKNIPWYTMALSSLIFIGEKTYYYRKNKEFLSKKLRYALPLIAATTEFLVIAKKKYKMAKKKYKEKLEMPMKKNFAKLMLQDIILEHYNINNQDSTNSIDKKDNSDKKNESDNNKIKNGLLLLITNHNDELMEGLIAIADTAITERYASQDIIYAHFITPMIESYTRYINYGYNPSQDIQENNSFDSITSNVYNKNINNKHVTTLSFDEQFTILFTDTTIENILIEQEKK